MVASLRVFVGENQEFLDHLRRVIAVTDSYDGYTSGSEDAKFFSGTGSTSKQLVKDLTKQNEEFEKMIRDIELCLTNVR